MTNESKMKKKISSLLLASLFICLAVLFRTAWHLGPNIEFITTASFLAATYLGGAWSAIIPFLSMVISDKIIGNTNIYLFTWSAFILIGLADFWFLKKFGRKKLIAKQMGMGISASLFFYLYTNFGVWFLDSFGMYPKTLKGLLECYLAGLSFLKFNLLGNLAFLLPTFLISESFCGIIKLCKKPLFTLKDFFVTH